MFSRACGLLVKSQEYRNLSQIGVILHRNGVETHVLAERRGRGFFVLANFFSLLFTRFTKVLKF